jgi:translation initiation factor 1A
MPNKGGKKKGKRNNTSTLAPKRALIYKEELEEYAQVSKLLGDRRLMVTLPDKSETLAIIPGRFRKRCWMKVGDVVIVSRREFEVGKMDVIYKYNDDEIRKLIKDKEIPEYFTDALASNNSDNEEVDFEWDEDGEEDEEEYIFEPKKEFTYDDIGKDIDIDGI